MSESASNPASSPDSAPEASPGLGAGTVHVQRSALVPHAPAQMYALVADVRGYPRCFDWCSEAEVLEEDGLRTRARLGVRLSGMTLRFATENVGVPGQRLDLRLVEGPFRHLEGHWSFHPIGAIGCRVELDLRFQLASGLLSGAVALGFRRIADRMVDDFCKAARRLHG